MKKLFAIGAILAPLAVAACGHTDRTVVVQPPAQSSGSTVVVPAQPNTNVTKICPAGQVTC